MLLRQNWGAPWAYGMCPIPEWSDDEIEDLERRDVHSSRCRCEYCKARSDELAFGRFCAAQRKADKLAKAEARRERAAAGWRARHWEDEPPAKPQTFAPVTLYPIDCQLLTGEELFRFLEYRHSETTLAKLQSTGTLRSA